MVPNTYAVQIHKKQMESFVRRNMTFFESEIVQEEAKRLFTDYQELMKLGSDYGKFDREGKKMFIATMEELMERYKVFMKRFELSEDFQAKMTVEQLKTIRDQIENLIYLVDMLV